MSADSPAPSAAPAEGKSASSGPPPTEAGVPVVELDRALAPIRRLAAWASRDPESRGEAVPYAEATVGRWVARALDLDLPEPIAELVAAQRDAVSGYDAADSDGRADRLASLYQAVCRTDSLLGLPVHGVRIRRPKKPRLPDWRVEETEAPEPEEAAAGDSGSGRSKGRSGRSRKKKTKKKAFEQAPPPPPLWNGKTSEPLDRLPMPEALREALGAAGVSTVGDLLLLPPVDTERLRPVHGAGRPLPEGVERAAVGGRVRHRITRLFPDGRRQTRVRLKGAGPLDLVWEADSPVLASTGGVETWEPGERAIAVGTPSDEDGTTVLRECERAWDDGAGGVRLRAYGIDGVDDQTLRAWIGRLLPLLGNVRDILPGSELSRLDLEPLRVLLEHLHHRDLDRARRRLAFDEALLVQLGLAVDRYRKGRDRGLQLTPLHSLITRLTATNGLELSDDQQRVFEAIKRDIRRRSPMRRVLTGPVGSGRGLVALLTSIAVAEGKVQVVVTCPDAQAAEQRYLFSALTLRDGGLVARLVEGAPTRAMRDAIGRGEIHVVFGTPELLEADLEFRRLGLVISEEREQLGAASRAVAKMKAPRPHLLVMPTVPIGPRLAFQAYADHDISGLPDGAPAPRVSLYPASDRAVVYGRAAEVVGEGGQVLVVFPQVKGADALDLREAWRLVRALESDAFGKARMGLLHGSMSREDRLQAYEDFERRRLDVLVATAPVEGAPASLGARAMVLEQAERIAPHRLARLRGFLDPERGTPVIWGVCAGNPDEVGDRLTALTQAPVVDPADRVFDGAPPLPSLQWLDLDRDQALVWRARDAAHRMLRSDSRLRAGWMAEVGRTLRDRWESLYGDDGPSLDLDPPRRSESASGGGRKRRRRRRRRKR